jgi:hypothetical protein
MPMHVKQPFGAQIHSENQYTKFKTYVAFVSDITID